MVKLVDCPNSNVVIRIEYFESCRPTVDGLPLISEYADLLHNKTMGLQYDTDHLSKISEMVGAAMYPSIKEITFLLTHGERKYFTLNEHEARVLIKSITEIEAEYENRLLTVKSAYEYIED